MSQNQDSQKIKLVSVLWPFTKHTILMPEMIGLDLFEWLYIKLIVFYNKSILKLSNPYVLHPDSILFVDSEIKKKFNQVINSEILSKVKNSVYGKTHDEVDGLIHTGKRCFGEDVVNALNLELTFGKVMNTYTVYQECVLGEVIPYFDDEIDEDFGDDYLKIDRKTMISPTSKDIVRGYEIYSTKSKGQEVRIHIDSKSEENEILDTETETKLFDFSREIDFTINEMEVSESPKADPSKVNIVFLNKSELIYLKIDISEDEYGEYKVDTPFGYFGNDTFSRIIHKAERTNTCTELNKLLCLIKSTDEQVMDNTDFLKFEGRDGSMDYIHFKEIYLLSKAAKDRDLVQYMRLMDREFDAHSSNFFLTAGKYLEGLIETVTDREDRKMSSDYFDQSLTQVFQHFDWVVPIPFKNAYNDWSKGRKSFKADVLDILLRHPNALIAEGLDKYTIKKVFEIYNVRNTYVHHTGRKHVDDSEFDSSISVELANFTRYIINLY